MSHGGALVLGIGNILLQDEGVGVVVARQLESARLEAARSGAAQTSCAGGIPADTRIVDGGTLGLDLLPMIGEANQVVIIDAVNLGKAPGTVTVLHDDAVQAALSGHVSPHQIGVGDLVAAARLMGIMPARLALIGIQPGTIAIGLELTESVAAAVQVAADLALKELAEPGQPPSGAAGGGARGMTDGSMAGTSQLGDPIPAAAAVAGS